MHDTVQIIVRYIALDASCDTIHNQPQYHCINEQKYHQNFHPKVREPNAFIPSEDFAHIGIVFQKVCKFHNLSFLKLLYKNNKSGIYTLFETLSPG